MGVALWLVSVCRVGVVRGVVFLGVFLCFSFLLYPFSFLWLFSCFFFFSPFSFLRSKEKRKRKSSSSSADSDDSSGDSASIASDCSEDQVFCMATGVAAKDSQLRLISWAKKHPGKLASLQLMRMDQRIGRPGVASHRFI